MVSVLACFLTLAAPQKSVPYHFESLANAKKGYWDTSTRYPVFTGESALVRFASPSIRHDSRKALVDFVAQAKEDLLPPKGQKPDRGYYAYEAKSEVIMANPDLISVLTTSYFDTLGAHPNSFYVEFNYGLVGGKPTKLKLKDLFVKKADCVNEVAATAVPLLKDKGASEALQPDFKFTPLLAEQFVIEKDGLRYWFAPYDVAYYAMGPFTVKVPFSKLPSLDRNGPLKRLLPK